MFLEYNLDKRRIAMVFGSVSSLLFGRRSCFSQFSIYYVRHSMFLKTDLQSTMLIRGDRVARKYGDLVARKCGDRFARKSSK